MTTLDQRIVDILNSDATQKLLATVDGQGVPHAEYKPSMHVGRDGKIHCLEFNEGSITNRNLVRSIWFDRPLIILLKGEDGHNIQISGKAVKNVVSGPLFQQHYINVRKEYGDIDLAGVWVITPNEIID